MKRRLCELNINDHFIWLGKTYRIIFRSKAAGIVFQVLGDRSKHSYGLNCQMIVEYIKVVIKTHNKPVSQFTLRGDHVMDFNSIIEAAEKLGVSANAISQCANGRWKTSAAFMWKFIKPV